MKRSKIELQLGGAVYGVLYGIPKEDMLTHKSAVEEHTVELDLVSQHVYLAILDQIKSDGMRA